MFGKYKKKKDYQASLFSIIRKAKIILADETWKGLFRSYFPGYRE